MIKIVESSLFLAYFKTKSATATENKRITGVLACHFNANSEGVSVVKNFRVDSNQFKLNH
jgi:hypothetical protein